jgi:hypothetical protein
MIQTGSGISPETPSKAFMPWIGAALNPALRSNTTPAKALPFLSSCGETGVRLKDAKCDNNPIFQSKVCTKFHEQTRFRGHP